ncbi:centrosomal protein POC5 [Arapaima gigas]
MRATDDVSVGLKLSERQQKVCSAEAVTRRAVRRKWKLAGGPDTPSVVNLLTPQCLWSQMSTDEEQPSSPALLKDSDRCSSVSSALQDEYEELLRYAVVTPKFDADALRQPHPPLELSASGRLSVLTDNGRFQDAAESVSEQEHRRLPDSELTSARATPLETSPGEHLGKAQAEQVPLRNSAEFVMELEGGCTAQESSRHSRPDTPVAVVTEMFISEENMSRMENILDTWSNNLKASDCQLRKWKLSFVEHHRQELKKERQRHAAHTAALGVQMDGLKELLHTYETSNQRKDEVISNLTHVIERHREKLELMRTFMQWRMQHLEMKEEAHGTRIAERHYRLHLKRKAWLAWHSLIETTWRERVERACRARAEEVCMQLSANYEAKIAQNVETLDKARAEIQRLHAERERVEESMKKAFMRGVCALNMEAMNMFHGGETRVEQDPTLAREEPGSSTSVRFQPQPSSTRFSPVHFQSDSPPTQSELSQLTPQPSSSSGLTRAAEGVPATTAVNPALPPGGTATTHTLSSARVVTSGQQKAMKTITARITGRSDLGAKASCVSGGNLQVMSVAPPMTSVIVERHHPVTQLTMSQALAAKFPRSSQPPPEVSSGRGSSQTPRTVPSSQIHSIKLCPDQDSSCQPCRTVQRVIQI